MPANQSILELILRSRKQGRGAAEASKEVRGFKQELGGMLKVQAGVTASATAVGVAMKKAFDLGREGAVVIQTTKSFTGLLEKLELAPDLLDDLREASRGTVSDVELMSSTLSLAAGSGDELAREMIKAAPRLLEIAKASNVLNPALGDTAFLYDSLATGIKRSSPLILDNLGLTISVARANEAYATSLGKTSKQLTVNEQKLALLAAVVDDAGQALIEQAGGTDSATDAFDRLDASTKNIADRFKASLVPVLADAAEGLELILTYSERLDKITEEHEQDVRKTAETYDEYRKEMERVAELKRELVVTTDDENEILLQVSRSSEIYSGILRIMTESEFNAIRSAEGLSYAHEEWRLGLDRTRPTLEQLVGVMDDVSYSEEEIAEKTKIAAAHLRDMESATLGAAGAIDTNLSSSIANFRDELAFIMGGGLALQRMFEDVEEAALEGALTPEQADMFLKELFVASEELQVDLGQITADEAAENIRTELGGSLTEAKTKLDKIDQGLDDLERDIEITIRYNVEGSLPMPLPNYQHGGQFVVGGVPGPDRNLVAFRASKNETVTITPAGGHPSAGMTFTGDIIIQAGPGANGRQIVDEMMAEISRRVSIASTSGAAFVGG